MRERRTVFSRLDRIGNFDSQNRPFGFYYCRISLPGPLLGDFCNNIGRVLHRRRSESDSLDTGPISSRGFERHICPHIARSLSRWTTRARPRRWTRPDRYLPSCHERLAAALARVCVPVPRFNDGAVGPAVEVIVQPAAGRHLAHRLATETGPGEEEFPPTRHHVLFGGLRGSSFSSRYRMTV